MCEENIKKNSQSDKRTENFTREFDHRIDLLPGASLPNFHYRLGPKEAHTLQSQVDQLLKEGLIRPSISPCAVPVLLVPKKNGE